MKIEGNIAQPALLRADQLEPGSVYAREDRKDLAWVRNLWIMTDEGVVVRLDDGFSMPARGSGPYTEVRAKVVME